MKRSLVAACRPAQPCPSMEGSFYGRVDGADRLIGWEADFVGIVAVSRGELTRTAYLMCGDWHQAEDVVQVVLARM
jgi:hypothetical protein